MKIWLRRLLGLSPWVVLGLVVLTAGVALARVGGGEGFGGGGGGGGGGGDGGGGDLLAWAIYLAIRYPVVGVPLLIVVAGFMYYRHKAKEGERQQRAVRDAQRMRLGRARQRRGQIAEGKKKLLEDDPNFSEILFLDFAQMVYTRFQESRGSRQLEGVRPYLSAEMFGRLGELAKRFKPGQFVVSRVIVGSVSLGEIRDGGERWSIACEVEANYDERIQTGEGQTAEEAYFARCQMTFQRAKGVLSKGPEQMRTLGCPSCGAPIKQDRAGVCAYCGQAVRPGEFHWELAAMNEVERRPRVQVPLGAGGMEAGTDMPTVFDPALQVQHKQFQMTYPGESLQRLVDRAREVFVQLQQAWTSGKWEQARAFETDRLFQMHLFWMERYREKKLRNVLDQIKVLEVTIVKIDRDAFFETVTVRIKASMLDYIVDAEGNLKSGSKDEPRVFSEYWTFIRKRGFDPEKQTDTRSCPSCGAPVKVSMHGRCEYCDANLSSGDFDWTLAKIEQDEVYVG